MSQDEPTGAVVPLDSQASADPWRSLSEGSGVLMTWQPLGNREPASWGPALKASSALAQQISRVASDAGASSAITAGSALFRLELPTGSTMQNLVPAVGGGFRGLVRGSEGAKIAGQARLVPVSGAAVGAGIALGPLVALMALSVGAEMLARKQQDQKIESIRTGVRALNVAADEQMRAELKSAEQALEMGAAAVLDRIEIPSSVGLGPARNNLRVIRNRGLDWLQVWRDRIAEHSEGEQIDVRVMKEVLKGDSGLDYTSFRTRVETIYRALALDSRALVLTGAEAGLHEGASLSRVEEQLHRDLALNTESQSLLREVLWELADRPVTFSLPARDATRRQAVELTRGLQRLARAVSDLPDAPGMLSNSGRQVLEVVRDDSGQLRLLAPVESH